MKARVLDSFEKEPLVRVLFEHDLGETSREIQVTFHLYRPEDLELEHPGFCLVPCSTIRTDTGTGVELDSENFRRVCQAATDAVVRDYETPRI